MSTTQAAITAERPREARFQRVVLVIARLALAYLFFTQLWWKTPPTFGCPPDFAFTTADASGRLQRTSGLCDWLGVESVWATRPHPVFAANLDNQGGPDLALNISPLARLNGWFIDRVVMPNIRWFGWVVWGVEAFIFVSLFFGVVSRFGGLVAIAQSAQLWVGLAGIGNPYEFEWTYNLMVMLSILVFAFAPGRVFGIDQYLRPRLQAAASEGSRLAEILAWLT